MGWLYNRRFKIGAALVFAVFTVANVVSYVGAARRHAEFKASHHYIEFPPNTSPLWGFPFIWDGGLGPVFNLASLLLGALFFGLLFRWITGIIK